MATQITTNPGSGSGNLYIDSLVWGNASWSLDEPINVGFWSGYSTAYDVTTTSFSSGELAAFYQAMADYSAVSNLTFNVISNPSESLSSSNTTDIIWYIFDGNEVPVLGNLAGIHEVPDGQWIWTGGGFNEALTSWNNVTPGSFSYSVILHELGHGMGLAHPHDGGGDGNLFPGVSSWSDTGTNALNQNIWTTMSYNEGWAVEPTNTTDYGHNMTLMAFDIAALQAMYGANNTYNTGNNTYTIPTSSGSGVGWECIWDAGGSDTISNAGSNQGATINLNAAPLVGENAGGYVSWNSGVTGGYTIANNVVIENAIGGNGNDVITGNSANNTLIGGSGNDTFYASGGSNMIDGGSGYDAVTISGSYANNSIGVNNNTTIIKDDNGNVTTITDVENFNFSDQSWSLQNLGNAVDHEDVLELYYEQVYNGTDYDQVWKMPDLYSFPENPGLEALIDYQYTGGIGGDIIIGTSGNEFINAGDGADAVNAGDGNDIIDGGLESNFLTGGTGNDIFFADGRDSSNETWTTITDFTDGTCSATLWGYIEGTSTYFWEENQGAGGQWNGATLRCDFDNDGVVDTSMTFTGMTQGQLNLVTSSVFDPVSQTDLGYIMIT